MRKFRRVLALSLVLVLAMAMLPACKKPYNSKKTIRIYCWNEEFKSRFETYYVPNSNIENFEKEYKIDWVVTPSDNGAYQDKLDADLPKNSKADKRIDIFLIEADYALKYVNSDYTLDVKTLGLTDSDLAQQYDYTKQIATDNNGALKAVSWQATPGLFIYNRTLAKEVLGTDDPTKVQAELSNWTKFDAVAAKMKEAGHFMLSGYDDSFRTFSNNVSGKWVQNGNVVIDDNIWKWIDQTKTYTEKGYNNKTSLWKPEWVKGQGANGNVFGYFYSTWGIAFTMKDNSLAKPVSEGGKYEVGNGSFGDWAACEGPQSYYWGGTWICAAKGTDNEDVVLDVMKVLTCNKDVMKQITEKEDDYVNNKAAIDEISKNYKSDFLGGQNHIALLAKAADKIDMSNTTPYDQILNEGIQSAFKDYFDGKIDKAKALENFKEIVKAKYKDLNTDNLKVK